VATAPVLEKVLRGFYSTQMGFERIRKLPPGYKSILNQVFLIYFR
jgi:hypothetical protein